MARPKKVLEPANENIQTNRRVRTAVRSKAEEPANENIQTNRRGRAAIEKRQAEVPITNGQESVAKGNRKRKIAVVAPLQEDHDNVQDKPSTSHSRKTAKVDKPIVAKKFKESLQKKTTLKKVAAAGRVAGTLKDAPAVKKPCIPIPGIPALAKGEALALGTGDVGQLGLGSDIMEKGRPVPIPNINEVVVDIAAGGMHSACLTSKGNVYTFGCNDDGTLGRPTEEEEDGFVPGKVDITERVVMVSAGDSHTAALTETGAVYIWGNFRDSSGQMGLTSDGEKVSSPLRILENIQVAGLASGAEHLICLGTDGQIYSMGNGEQGQLGRIAPYFNFRGGRKGLGYILTPNVVRLEKSRSGTGSHKPEFDRVWAGVYCTFAREKNTGTIYGFGLNNYNQLGELPTISRKEKGEDEMLTKFMPTPLKSLNGHHWNMISGGMHHTLGLDDKGNVYSWGRKEYGRLGLENVTTDQSKPVQIPHLKKVKCVHVGCGTTTSYAVSATGVMYSWGFGENQQLGHGNSDDVDVPKEVESKAMKARKAVKAVGGGQHTLVLASRTEESNT